ncbi:alpha-mannosidase [Paenibacillus psychroresistens]|uniref:Alpha-mannosidase n=1 Tax=Paenibacillus psychroresistens TaxID=1778678 RepID=A0A6B8RGR0_9BACL|nr:alpha-mannosidase [Paenibacillus psychroresistens]QGQ95127.1 alpha-mannosidase [Paenibacillus psychroresistens]
MNSKVVHVISHTHWDREWYMPYEKHHVRLIKLMDSLIDLFEQDPHFASFHLDGQTIILEDYLQVRPERKQKLIELVKAGNLHIGPWYILQDEFLISSEANVRNLLVGLRDAKAYGDVCKIGYFPDSFGNMGQAPQLLRQAGMDTAVFGRGVKPVGVNNTVEESAKYESPFSEMNWRGADGSVVTGILFANWYHNGMEIPVNEAEALIFWQERLGNVERFASTSHLLLMNGCDHQPVQSDLSMALETARKLFPDIDFRHSNFRDYIGELKLSFPEELAVVQGELRSQQTNGWGTLVNTASTRVYIKQANQLGQAMLEKVAEPLAAFAHLLGTPYPHHLLTYAWKTLMQNHPHDSICGCSVDEVHQEMMTRFAKSLDVADEIAADSMSVICALIDTSCFIPIDTDTVPFIVFNTSGWIRTGVIQVELEIKRISTNEMPPQQAAALLKNEPLLPGDLINSDGGSIPFTMEDLGVQFSYDLPNDRFRQPYMTRKIRLTFEAEKVPALGYKAYGYVNKSEKPTDEFSSMVKGNGMLENEWLKVHIAFDGSIQLTHKESGHTFNELCVYENVGDIGNEYTFKQPEGDSVLTTKGLPARINLVENTAFRASYEIVHDWAIPASADEDLLREMQEIVGLMERRSQRTQETVLLSISTLISLEKGERGLKVQTKFNNQAKDHRVRVLFPTDLQTTVHHVDSIFEVATRSNEPSEEWVNPSNCQHQQAFVRVSDEKMGLTIANLGLQEYEVLRDGHNTIAITLLRSVGELGDWGHFPTPEAQCLGKHEVNFMIIPHAASGMDSGAYVEAYQYQIPWMMKQTLLQSGSIPANHGFLEWSGNSLALSSVKIAEETNDFIVRWFNMSLEETELQLKGQTSLLNCYKSNILEEKEEQIAVKQNDIKCLTVNSAEIVTLGFRV